LILIALIVGFAGGVVVGWVAQQGLDRVLRYVAVRRAIRATVAAMRAPGTSTTRPTTPEIPAPPANLTPWFADRTTRAGRPVRPAAGTSSVTARPGMPFYRDHAC
jgi:hypothetical protein